MNVKQSENKNIGIDVEIKNINRDTDMNTELKAESRILTIRQNRTLTIRQNGEF